MPPSPDEELLELDEELLELEEELLELDEELLELDEELLLEELLELDEPSEGFESPSAPQPVRPDKINKKPST